MKNLLFGCLMVCIFAGITGCADTTKVKKETTITTPEGKTTTTTEQKIEKSGSNPPAAQP